MNLKNVMETQKKLGKLLIDLEGKQKIHKVHHLLLIMNEL